MLSLRPLGRSRASLSAPRAFGSHDDDAKRRGRRPLRLAKPAGGEPSADEKALRKRVLIVDDEASIRALCRVNLQLAGLEVIEAEDGEAALEQIADERPDIVLLDVMMPRLDGWEVAQRLGAGAETRDVPIVFLSARAGQEDRRQGFDAGGVGYVVKPFDPVTLAATLQHTLDRLERGERDELRLEMLEQ
jgi:DNA-binding response OmpR family regulator